MSNLRNLIAFHKRAHELIKQTGRGVEAWEQTEKEYFEIDGKSRYKNYKSFRQIHWQIMTGNYIALKK